MSKKVFIIPVLSLVYKASGVEISSDTARMMFGAMTVVMACLWGFVYRSVVRSNCQDKVHVTEKDPYTSKETKRVMSACDYDLAELRKLVQTTVIGMCIVGILHFYKGYIPPLIFQSVLLPINFVDSQLFKIHVLKEAPVGGLKRPFKVEGPFKFLDQLKAQETAKAEKAAKKERKKKAT